MRTMPTSFIAESDLQRQEDAAELSRRAAELLAATADTQDVFFDREAKHPEMFALAAKVAEALGHYAAERITSVHFEPTPHKSEGCWRIHVSLEDGMCCGAEWYVDGDKLWETWERMESVK
jgi:hypothetical protein